MGFCFTIPEFKTSPLLSMWYRVAIRTVDSFLHFTCTRTTTGFAHANNYPYPTYRACEAVPDLQLHVKYACEPGNEARVLT